MTEDREEPPLTPQLLLQAYAAGIFPMSDGADAKELYWVDPPLRGVIPLDQRFHIPRRLARTLRHAPFDISLNTAFGEVMRGCAAPQEGRETTWINDEILALYTALHYRGHAHSIEVREAGVLVGGLYGVSLGCAFFGESMFSRKTDASKIALVHLVALLRGHGYSLLDAQFQTAHLSRFGTQEISKKQYHARLDRALQAVARPFPAQPDWRYLLEETLSLQPVSQIS